MTEEIEYIEEELVEQVDETRSALAALDSAPAHARGDKLDDIESMLTRFRHLIKSFKVELREIPATEVVVWEEKLKRYQRQVDEFASEHSAAKAKNERAQLGAAHGGEINVEMASVNELVDAGHAMQRDDLNRLNRMQHEVGQIKQIGTDTAVALQGQTEQLKQVSADLDEIDSELKRADKLLRVFLRRVMTDKIIMCFMFLVFLGVIGAIVASSVPTGSSDDVKDEIPS